jgi:hypothetical protein
MSDQRAKIFAAIFLIMVECVVVALAIDRLFGFKSPMASAADFVLTAIVVAEILLVGGLRVRIGDQVQPYIES